MSYLKQIEMDIVNALKMYKLEIDDVKLVVSTSGYGHYQINDCFRWAKLLKKKPLDVAEEVANYLKGFTYFEDVTITKPGFINLKMEINAAMSYFNNLKGDFKNHLDQVNRQTILIDYGGANVAKTLHVGHMRSPNIGEALKRLCQLLGHDVIADTHLGDSGMPPGIILSELKRLYPDMPYFEDLEQYPDDYDLSLVNLDIIYPNGSNRVNANENDYKEAERYALALQQGHPGLNKLWSLIKNISINEIKKIYVNELNTTFDLYESEVDSFQYLSQMDEILKNRNLIEESEGMKVITVAKSTDKKEMPPFIVYKSNGAALYSTTDLATLIGRINRFELDQIWYITDNRQSMHFEQLFRVADMLKIDVDFTHIGFGTIKGPNNKPLKTRAGDNIKLLDLIKEVKVLTKTKLSDKITDHDLDEINQKIAIGALKYADLSTVVTSDYIFDINKFTDTDGKTGPYMQYSAVRIKSLLKKATALNISYQKMTDIKNEEAADVLIELINLPIALTNAYNGKSLNDICEYLYKLNAKFNKFYGNNNILNEPNKEVQQSWLMLSDWVYKANVMLLDVLAIEVPEVM